MNDPLALVVSENTVSNNRVAEDLVIGSQIKFVIERRSPDALIALIERSKQLSENDPEYRAMIEELDSFLESRPGRQVIGLEAKLKKAGRDDLLDDAEHLANRFSRRLAKNQMSPSMQALYLHCLSRINTAFCSFIQPLIRGGATEQAIDAAICQMVVDNLYEEVTSVDSSLSTEMIRGMLYFLTGKCHLKWE